MSRQRKNGNASGDGKRRKRCNGSGTLVKKGRTYFARWYVTNADGTRRRVTQSTGTGDLEEARAFLNGETARLGLGKDADTLAARALDALKTANQKAEEKREELEDAATAIPIRGAFEAFRAAPNRPLRASAETLAMYECQYSRFEEWLRNHHPEVTHLRAVTQEIADAFIQYVGSTFSAGTYNKYITLLACVWKTLEEKGRLRLNPWAKMSKKTNVAHSRRELTVEELARVLAPLEGETRLLFAVGIYTGLRLRDCACLEWGSVDLVRGFIRLTPHKGQNKTHAKEVVIPLHRVLAGMLAEIPARARTGFVMPELAGVYHADTSNFSKRVQAVFENAGIRTQYRAEGQRTRVDVGFHSLRHTFVSISANAGVPLALVQAIVGHSNPAMTRHYFHESEEALKNAVSTLPDVTGADVAAESAKSAEGRFSGVYAALDGMTEAELREVAAYVAKKLEEVAA